MDPVRAMKSVFIYANYGLLDFKHEMGAGYDAFAAMSSNQEEGDSDDGVVNHDDEFVSPLLRRGCRITEDTRSSDDSDTDEGEDGEGSDKPDPVAWSMPDGFTLGAEPSKLDASLVGKYIYMRWKDYGWQLGKVYEQITNANPRLFKKSALFFLFAAGAHHGNTFLGRADAVMATGRGALPRESMDIPPPAFFPCCIAISCKPENQPAAQRHRWGGRAILRSVHPQPSADSNIP